MSPHCDPNCGLKRSHPAAGSEVLMGCRGIAADGGNTQTTAVPLGVGRGLHSHRRPLQRGALTHRRRALSSTVRHGEGPTPQVWASACAHGGATGAIRRARREAAARLRKTLGSGGREIREDAGARRSDSTFSMAPCRSSVFGNRAGRQRRQHILHICITQVIDSQFLECQTESLRVNNPAID